jgi:hypothetical protein
VLGVHDVFLSHATDDLQVVTAICHELEGRGIRCWYAKRDAQPGEPWSAAITGAIADARIMVLVLSGKSNDSQHVRKEVTAAVSRELHLIPIRIEEVTPSDALEYLVGDCHWLDALTPPRQRQIEALADRIARVLELPAAQAPTRHEEPASAKRAGPMRLIWPIVVLLLAAGAYLLASGGDEPKPTKTDLPPTVKRPPANDPDHLARRAMELEREKAADWEQGIAELTYASEASVKAHIDEIRSAWERAEEQRAAEEWGQAEASYRTVVNRLSNVRDEERRHGELHAAKQAYEAYRAETQDTAWRDYFQVAIYREQAHDLEKEISEMARAYERGDDWAQLPYLAGLYKSALHSLKNAVTTNESVLRAEAARARIDQMRDETSSIHWVNGHRLQAMLDDIDAIRQRGEQAYETGHLESAEREWAEAATRYESNLSWNEGMFRDEVGTRREEISKALTPGEERWYLAIRKQVETLGSALEALPEASEVSARGGGDLLSKLDRLRQSAAQLRDAHIAARDAAQKALAELEAENRLVELAAEDAVKRGGLAIEARALILDGDFDAARERVTRARALRAKPARPGPPTEPTDTSPPPAQPSPTADIPRNPKFVFTASRLSVGTKPAGWTLEGGAQITTVRDKRALAPTVERSAASAESPPLRLLGNFSIDVGIQLSSSGTTTIVLVGADGAPDVALTIKHRGNSGGWSCEFLAAGLRVTHSPRAGDLRLRIARLGGEYVLSIEGRTKGTIDGPPSSARFSAVRIEWDKPKSGLTKLWTTSK